MLQLTGSQPVISKNVHPGSIPDDHVLIAFILAF